MTEIHFHHHVPQRDNYICRLLRKAYASNAQVAVLGTHQQLLQLDKALWEIGELDFIPHTLMSPSPLNATDSSDSSATAEQKYARIQFVESLNSIEHHHMVLNLLDTVPMGFERFDRLIEVVGLDTNEREKARMRTRSYKSKGYAISYYPYQDIA